MKQPIQNLIVTLALVLPLLNYGQDSDRKITIEITKDIDGEKKTFKGEYDSVEEMRADPNYQEFADEEDNFNFWFGQDDDMDIHLDLFGNQGGGQYFRFFDSDDDEEGNSFFYKHFDQDSDDVFDFQFDGDDSEEHGEKMRKLGEEMRELLKRFNEDADGSNNFSITVWKKVKVTDVDDEFGKKGRVDKNNELILEDLNFYPNPSSNGRFKVRFTTPKEGELTIKVSNLEGKEVFSRYFDSFSGRYSEAIDLSGQKEGIYLLEIIQGKKRLTKKIVIN